MLTGHNVTEEINALMRNFGLYTIKKKKCFQEAWIDYVSCDEQPAISSVVFTFNIINLHHL